MHIAPRGATLLAQPISVTVHAQTRAPTEELALTVQTKLGTICVRMYVKYTELMCGAVRNDDNGGGGSRDLCEKHYARAHEHTHTQARPRARRCWSARAHTRLNSRTGNKRIPRSSDVVARVAPPSSRPICAVIQREIAAYVFCVLWSTTVIGLHTNTSALPKRTHLLVAILVHTHARTHTLSHTHTIKTNARAHTGELVYTNLKV